MRGKSAPDSETGIASRARASTARSDTLRRIEAVWPEILRGVEMGATPIVSAGAAGVPSTTFLRWRALMESGDAQLVPFFEQLEMTIAKAELSMLSDIRRPEKDDYGRTDSGPQRGAMFVLERSRRERWGPKLDVTVETQRAAVRAILDGVRPHMSDAAFKELLAAIATLGACADDPNDAIGDLA